MAQGGVPLNPSIRLGDGSTVMVVSCADEWEIARPKLLKAMDIYGVLGLDVEFLVTSEEPPPENQRVQVDVPNDYIRINNIRKKKDPLLQLAAPKLAVLIQMCFFDVFPPSLVELLDSKDIIYVGVEIQGDRQRLQQMHKLHVRQVLDLRYVIKQSRKWAREYDGSGSGLKAIGSFLGMQIVSPETYHWTSAVQNWAAPRLSRRQIEYAANDALAAVGSYIKLVTDYLHHPINFTKAQPQFWAHYRSRFRPVFNKAVDKIDRDQRKPKNRRKLDNTLHNADSDIELDLDECLLKAIDKQKLPTLAYFYDPNQQLNSEDSTNSTRSFNTANSTTRSQHSNASMVSISSQKDAESTATQTPSMASDLNYAYMTDSESESEDEADNVDLAVMLDKKVRLQAKKLAAQINEEQGKGAVMHVDEELLYWMHSSGVHTINMNTKADVGSHTNLSLGIQMTVEFE